MKEQVIELRESIYNRGLTDGTGSFNEKQKVLYDCIDLLTYLEMDGFTGFLYNNIHKEDRMKAFTNCLTYFGLSKQADKLHQVYSTYSNQEREEAEIWTDSLIRANLDAEVAELEDRLYNDLVGVRIEEWIERNFEELSIN